MVPRFMLLLALAGVLFAVPLSSVHAQVFADLDGTKIDPRIDPVVYGTAPLTYFSQVQNNTTITKISVYNQLLTAGNMKFLIFDTATPIPVYNSGPMPFPAQTGLTWNSVNVTSSYMLLVGHTYYIGALSNVAANYGYNTDGSFTQNGLTSAQMNGTAEIYNTPIENGSGNGRIPIILYGSIAAAPEPSPSAILSILSLCLAGMVIVRKGRKSQI